MELKRIIIKKNVWISIKATILSGVKIESDSVIYVRVVATKNIINDLIT
jgi:acetyltransferase-like isoleucine patch superfamily enzyme